MRRILAIGVFPILALGCASKHKVEQLAPYDTARADVIAETIRHTYETRLPELDQSAQAHFALRMFRATGNSSNLDAVRVDVAGMVRDLEQTLDSLKVEGYLERRSQLAYAQERDVTPVLRARKDMFASRKEMLVHRGILYSSSKLREFGLHRGEFGGEYERARRHLRGVDFASFLLDPEVIRAYAAQASNLVYWLQAIDVVDLEEAYTRAYQSVFMSVDDEDLAEADYQNKLYGLTHFIIGDSRYYQRMVSAAKHKWILDYFDDHILEIVSWSKPDILAEIGLCFRLCGLPNHRVVGVIQECLTESFDPSLGFIPSHTGTTDLNLSEHRNAVAYMVMADWDKLHAGPTLEAGGLRALSPGKAEAPDRTTESPSGGELQSVLRAFDGAMSSYMESNGISAGLLGVMKEGEVIYERGYGWKDEARTVPLGSDAGMRIASISKPFTAAAIRRMIDSGRIGLDDHVFDLGQEGGGLLKLEPYPSLGDKRLKKVTVGHLLEHSGGWNSKSAGDLTFRELKIAKEIGVQSPPSRAQVAQWILGQPLQFSPGKKRIYSNEGYLFLGMIIEEVSGRSFLEYLYSEVLKPAGIEPTEITMAHTRYLHQHAREPWYDGGDSCASVVDPGAMVDCAYGGWYIENHLATGGLVSSSRALLRFMEAYYVAGPRIGEAMNKPDRGRWTLSHTGGFLGSSALARQRGDGIHYVVIFNKLAPPPGDYAVGIRELLDRIIEEKLKSGRGEVGHSRSKQNYAD